MNYYTIYLALKMINYINHNEQLIINVIITPNHCNKLGTQIR